MKKIQKILSLVLALMLVLSATVAIIPASAEETATNLITNGGFEDGTSSWNWNNFGVSTEIYYEGTQSLILNDSTKDYQNTYQVLTNVQPNTDYIFSFSYYAPNGVDGWGGWFVNAVPDGVASYNYFRTQEGTLAKGGYSACSEGEWKTVKARLTTTEITKLVIDFATRTNICYIDNVSLTLDPENGKIIKNGGFEYGSEVWSFGGDSTVSATEYYEGAASGKLPTAQYNKLSQQVTLEANTDYVASFYYKGSGYFKWGISTSESPDNKIGTAGAGLWGDTEWKYVRVLFNTGDNTDLYFTFMSGQNDIDIYIDNASIIPDPNPEDGLIVNGGFELDSYGWTTGGGAVEALDDGNSALKLPTGDYSKAHQLFDVTADTDYIVEFYYKGTATWMNKWGVGTTTGVELDQRISGGNLSTVTDWTRAYAYFNSGDNTSLYFSVMSGSNADMYIDNVKVYIDPNPVSGGLIKNSGFENGAELWNNVSENVSVTDTQAASGSYSLGYVGANSYKKISQDFACATNTDYIVTFKLYAPSAPWGCKYGVGTSSQQSLDTGAAGLVATYGVAGNTEWTTTSFMFSSGDNEALYLVFQGNGECEYYIDDICITAVSAGDANGDGAVNATDLTVLKQVILGTTVTHSTTGCKVRGEAEIDIRDLIRLKKALTTVTE